MFAEFLKQNGSFHRGRAVVLLRIEREQIPFLLGEKKEARSEYLRARLSKIILLMGRLRPVSRRAGVYRNTATINRDSGAGVCAARVRAAHVAVARCTGVHVATSARVASRSRVGSISTHSGRAGISCRRGCCSRRACRAVTRRSAGRRIGGCGVGVVASAASCKEQSR